jgi:hypothetical protein
MTRGSLFVPLVVLLSTCSTCVGTMRWQSRRIEVQGRLPDVFYVFVQTPEGPKAINLAREHIEPQDGWYAVPGNVSALADAQRIEEATAMLSKPGHGIVLRMEGFTAGPPARLSMMFNYDDYGYRAEYEVRSDGSVHPIASSSLVKRMGVVAVGWTILVMFVSWAAAHLVQWRKRRQPSHPARTMRPDGHRPYS